MTATTMTGAHLRQNSFVLSHFALFSYKRDSNTNLSDLLVTAVVVVVVVYEWWIEQRAREICISIH